MSNQKQLEKIRHSLSHLMSMAIMELYPKTGLGVGPTIENGFYQDYDLPESISDEILPKLEKRVRQMIKKNIKFKQHDLDFAPALKLYKDDPYKTELIKDLEKAGEKKVSFYKSDWFENLCKGPHVDSTKQINPKAFKLTKIAGAYWRGDEKNKMLTRIYGVAFNTEDELKEYLEMIKQAKENDHRKLGKELDLFTFSDLVGKGLPLWTPKGSIIRRELENFIIEEETKRGYLHVYTPDLAKTDLYKKSGHYPYYKDTMYPAMKVEEDSLILRPMACPHHFMLYADKMRSYKDLPLRIAELAKLYRYEKSGELTGLMRARSFCLADSHIFCRQNQVESEVKAVIDLIEFAAGVLGLTKGKDFWYRLSLGNRTDTKKYFKNDQGWDLGEKTLRKVLKDLKAPFVEAEDEAAFYGPKVDVQMKNVLGKEDTAFTVQYDLCLPQKFELVYTNEKGKDEEPIVIHRSSIGAIERTVAFLLEKTGGNLPLWLSPVQVMIIPIGQDHIKFSQDLAEEFREQGIRVEVDDLNETVGNKIRKASKQKTPYMLVIGDKEIQSKNLHVRKRGEKEVVEVPKKKFLESIVKNIEAKSVKLS